MAGYARKELSFAAHAACGNAEQRRTEGCITQVRRTRTRTQVRCTSHCASLAPRMGPVYRPKFAQVCLRRNIPHFGQRACDGYHSHQSVCSDWTDIVLKEVERGELGLLVALDGLADCAYALILEVVGRQIQGRQHAIDAQGIGNCFWPFRGGNYVPAIPVATNPIG